MVPTNSLDTTLNVSIRELESGDFVEEDYRVVKEAEHLIASLVVELAPIIKYVDIPFEGENGDIRGIVCAQERDTYLVFSRDASWYHLVRHGGDKPRITEYVDGWKDFVFATIFIRLADALKEAAARKLEHLTAIDTRSARLQEARAIFQK